ncbi:kinase-like domain-containing protein [Thelephora terrestris]|uniref:Kinase-like domain-containing protein n=1 Tax=Thelephora terrestris TaxID=56493 RepID=A0A9P6HK76_9AGAM|nr:kinase-like domain-containing protein [Thelephora terrestris]
MATDFNSLWKEARTQNETEFVRTVAQILASKEGRKFILTLGRADAELCVEILDHALSTRNLLRTSEKQPFFGTLRRLSGKHALLPESMVIKDEIEHPDSAQLQTSGGFADIKQGWYDGHMVAVKTMRVAVTDDFDKLRKQFCKEVIIWNSLSHPNVLKLLGVLSGFEGHQFATVSEWMVHGNIMEYIRKHSTNRLSLLHGAVKGLKYLHDANLVHGDLKGPNILMTNDTPPTACLADFGFTTLVLDPLNPMSSSLTLQGGTMTFMAPELLAPSNYGLKNSVPTREADIYAFGLVLFQVLTGDQPFRNYKPQELAYYVSLGTRPEKPANAKDIGISNALWELMQVCWHRKIEERPQIQEVVEGVKNAAAKWRKEMPPSAPEQREDYVEEESDELRHAGIFESYRSDEPQAPPAEEFEVVYSHLYQEHPPPSTTIPPKKHTLLSLPSVELLEAGDFDLEKLIEDLTGALDDDSQRNEILSLTGDVAVLVIECLDKIISSSPFRAKDIETRSRVFSTISRLSRRCQYLPRSYWIDPSTVVPKSEPHTSGTCANVYIGKRNDETVAVKVLRSSGQETPMVLKKRFCKEVILWKHVSYPYILTFQGVFYHNDVPVIVTPWMDNGNITEYLLQFPDADRLRLLLCVIKGVRYLHSCNIAHGDIKGSNVLISDTAPPKAMLADLGFTRVATISAKASSAEQGTVNFMAPELLAPPKFGLEKGVLTGKRPFFPKKELEIILPVISGARPTKPENAEAIGMTEDIWNLLQETWREDREKRPDISKILGTFCDITGERKAIDSTMGAEAQLDDPGRQNSVDSRSSFFTNRSSASRGSGTETRSPSSDTTAHSYDLLGQDKISEAKETRGPTGMPTAPKPPGRLGPPFDSGPLEPALNPTKRGILGSFRDRLSNKFLLWVPKPKLPARTGGGPEDVNDP